MEFLSTFLVPGFMLIIHLAVADMTEILYTPKSTHSIKAVVFEEISSEALSQDKEALLSLKSYFVQHNSNVSDLLYDWVQSNNNTCQWVGVKCQELKQGDMRVTFINLTGFALSGAIPSDFSKLPNLQYVDLSLNNLTGEIPEDIFSNCEQLRVLNLSSNGIQGQLPSGLMNCQNLQVLNLSRNALVGSLIPELGQLKNLQRLMLSFNNFSGAIPGSLLNSCGNLTELDLEYNSLKGFIPPIGVNCSLLSVVYLGSNHLYGELPKGLGLLRNLRRLTLDTNGFSGGIPSELGSLYNLELLSIARNNVSGSIPPSLGQMRSLEYLLLHKNNLTGSIPREIGFLHRLRTLDLNYNRLTGPIPSELCSIQSLEFLFLGSNSLEASIPLQIGNLTELQALDLSENQLSGEIPSTIGKLQRLLWLSVSENNLQGQIPLEIVNCSSLIWLKGGSNRFSGELPLAIGLMGRGAEETFRLNNKSDSILPREIGQCLAIARWIPTDFPFIYDTLNRDRCQAFWNNILRGRIPAPMCSFHPEAPGYIQLSSNRLNGTIPESLSNFTRLNSLYLAENMLSGPIPEHLGNLPLTFLNLSYNHFNGSIPASFSRLNCLTKLDLTSNNLQGIIPPSLGNLTSLSSFNISYNVGLRGPLPTGGQFSTFTYLSYLGNINLCVNLAQGSRQKGKGNYSFPLCDGFNNGSENPATGPTILGSNSSRNMLNGWEIVGLSVAIAMAVLLLASSCFWVALIWRLRSQLNSRGDSIFRPPSSDHPGAPVKLFGTTKTESINLKFTYRDIVLGTDNFDESRIIGRGGFGVVYRAQLGLQQKPVISVAIKRLTHDTPQTQKEFMAEMQTLGQLTHPNLVPLLGCCVAGSDRLLIYKLLRNGSLDDLLHEVPGFASAELNWPRRLKIALDAAMGLRFLHHECDSVIIHRDIKASNILLDEKFNAFITDFGLARTIAVEGSHVSTVIAGTLGYVPPEYSRSWKATAKGDVYSFGVILFELATGKRPLEASMVENYGGGTVDWARLMLKDNKAEDIADPCWLEGTGKETVVQFLNIAYDCTQEEARARPSMKEVVHSLQKIYDGLNKKSS
eukprot:Gb_19052 [translate_table: standard]